MKKLSFFLIFVTFTSLVFAGDVANFMNLGFSSNGNYFLFGEYGIDSGYQKAYGNMWLVDVKRNAFVQGGRFTGEYKTVIEPGESAIGALLKLIVEAQPVIKRYNIDYLEQGRPLYVRINDNDDVNKLNFRDFVTGLTYNFELNQEKESIGSGIQSSFGIDLETTDKAGKVRSYKIGNPGYKRSDVIEYKIERILHSSTGSNIVIVISKYIQDGEDVNIRYMVETISLK